MPIYNSFAELMREELPEIPFQGIQWTPERGKKENCPCWDQCYDVEISAENIDIVKEAMRRYLSMNACAFINTVSV